MGRRHETPAGWSLQAFRFALDPTEEQMAGLARHFGARRFVFNWTLEQIKAGVDAHHRGETAPAPSFYGLRRRWNQAKHTVAVDGCGQPWWDQVSKEALADGVRGAVDAYWRWQKSRSGKIAGRRVGFPRFKRKGRDRDRYSVTTGSFGLADRRHVRLPRIGVVRCCENTAKLDRLLAKDQARILAATVSRRGGRVFVSFRCEVARPQSGRRPRLPDSVVGVDVGQRRLATVADSDGTVIARIANPRALETNLAQLRRLNKAKARRRPGSIRHRQARKEISKLHARIADIRSHYTHVLTTHLAKTHGTVVVEDLNVAAMLTQRNLAGARTRRRRQADAALGEMRRQLRYKCGWYNSRLVEADRWFPSSQICSRCGWRNTELGWQQQWTCQCGTVHDRDDNAAVNLARYPAGDLGTVGASVKRRADHKTSIALAGGEEARTLTTREPHAGVRAA